MQAEQRLADADSGYYRALVDYMLAIKDVHLAKGSLLEYDGVSLAEGPWSTDAYRDALNRSRHFTPRCIDYGIRQPCPVSRGPYPQETGNSLPTPGGPGIGPGQPIELAPAAEPLPETPPLETPPAVNATDGPFPLPPVVPGP